jgi:hypothetical protein
MIATALGSGAGASLAEAVAHVAATHKQTILSPRIAVSWYPASVAGRNLATLRAKRAASLTGEISVRE